MVEPARGSICVDRYGNRADRYRCEHGDDVFRPVGTDDDDRFAGDDTQALQLSTTLSDGVSQRREGQIALRRLNSASVVLPWQELGTAFLDTRLLHASSIVSAIRSWHYNGRQYYRGAFAGD